MKTFLTIMSMSIFLCLTLGVAHADTFELHGLAQCNNPAYRCITVHPGKTWKQMFPDAKTRRMIRRLNRTNMSLAYRQWLIVPKDIKNTKYMSLSPFPAHIKAPGHRLLVVDLSRFGFAAYNGKGEQIYWGPATGGREWCDDLGRSCKTETGKFKIYRIQGAQCRSSKYPIEEKGGAPMPWCMHYFKGFAIHGSTLRGFVNTSRGCVRLFNSDAKWLNRHFVRYGTEVVVRR